MTWVMVIVLWIIVAAMFIAVHFKEASQKVDRLLEEERDEL